MYIISCNHVAIQYHTVFHLFTSLSLCLLLLRYNHTKIYKAFVKKHQKKKVILSYCTMLHRFCNMMLALVHACASLCILCRLVSSNMKRKVYTTLWETRCHFDGQSINTHCHPINCLSCFTFQIFPVMPQHRLARHNIPPHAKYRTT